MLKALVINYRVVHALVLREMTGRFGRSRLGYLWAFISPMLGIGALYLLFSTVRTGRTDLPLLMFLVTGWTTFGFYTGMFGRIATAAEANKALLMHPVVTRLDVVLGRIVLEVLTAVTLLIVYGTLSMAFEGSGLPADPLLAGVSFLTAGCFGTAVGMLLCALKTFVSSLDTVVAPINRIGFFVSAVLFTVSQLPSWAYDYIKWNPMVHPIEGIRQGWFAVYESPILNLTYTWAFIVPIFTLGLIIERRSRRRLEFG